MSALKGLVADKRLPQAEAAVIRKAVAAAEQKREKRKGPGAVSAIAVADEAAPKVPKLKKQKQ